MADGAPLALATNATGTVRVFHDVLRLPLVGFVCVFAMRAESVSADELIKKIESRYNGARTLFVNFTEDYSVLGHARPPESGTLTLRKQGKMRWNYTHPAGKLFVSDGKNVFLYTAGDNRVEKVPLKHTEDMRAPLAFLLGRLDMKKDFRDFELRPGEGGEWLKAAAKNDRVPYENVEMLVASDGSIRQLKVAGRDQSLLSFAFSGEKLNPAVSDSAFHFTIPPGAEVVDAAEIAPQEK
jgi:outer membrane lipoprotein carrier protein